MTTQGTHWIFDGPQVRDLMAARSTAGVDTKSWAEVSRVLRLVAGSCRTGPHQNMLLLSALQATLDTRQHLGAERTAILASQHGLLADAWQSLVDALRRARTDTSPELLDMMLEDLALALVHELSCPDTAAHTGLPAAGATAS
jgi:hypothetical protein